MEIFLFHYFREPAHVWFQHLGDKDSTIGRIMIVFHHGDQGAANGDAGTVERMKEACILLPFRAATGIHTAGLKIATS